MLVKGVFLPILQLQCKVVKQGIAMTNTRFMHGSFSYDHCFYCQTTKSNFFIFFFFLSFFHFTIITIWNNLASELYINFSA